MTHHRNKCNIMMIKYNLFIKLQCEHVNMQIRQNVGCSPDHLLALYTVNQKQKSIVLPGTRLMPWWRRAWERWPTVVHSSSSELYRSTSSDPAYHQDRSEDYIGTILSSTYKLPWTGHCQVPLIWLHVLPRAGWPHTARRCRRPSPGSRCMPSWSCQSNRHSQYKSTQRV